MKYIGTAFALAFSAIAIAHAQPDFARQQAWDQVQRSQMNMMIGRAGSNSGKDGGAGLPAYVKVFAKEKTYQGIGQFRLQEGSGFKGIKETAYIVLDGMNIFPEMTDSIEYMGEIGLRSENGWLFRTHRGKIAAFSPMPAGLSTHVSYDGGPIQEIKDADLEKAMQTTPISYAFLVRDRDYAIRLFDKYNGIDVYDPKAGISLSDLRRSVFHDAGNWAQEKPKPSDGLLQKLAKVKRACQSRKFDDGLGALGELEGKFPDFYLPYALEGECYEKQGNQKAALDAYQQARLYAPADAKLLETLSANITRTKSAARGK